MGRGRFYDIIRPLALRSKDQIVGADPPARRDQDADVNKSEKIAVTVLKELLAAGKLTPVIDRTYPLSDVPDAIRYLEAGQAKGKVVITI
jgi:NADPH:quinone reductase-like Zn-dependent oxidoreductase